MRKTLSEVIDLYLRSRDTRGFASNTVTSDDVTLRQFLAVIGNVQTGMIGPEHVEAFLAWGKTKDKQPWIENTQDTKLGGLRAFFKWCRGRGYMKPDIDPCGEMRWLSPKPRADRVYLPAPRFEDMLDAARHPQRRITYAVGLYLFTRGGETSGIKLKDVHLDRSVIGVTIEKTDDYDEMPVCEELEVEIRRWLSYYSSRVKIEPGSESDDYYLIPAKAKGMVSNKGGKAVYLPPPPERELAPTRRVGRVYDLIKEGLQDLGYPTYREGGHTLRRSGALALYLRLADDGHDRAIRWVQRMLHHSSILMTEKYLDLSVDKKELHDLIAGKRMFARPVEVIDLKAVRDGGL